MAPELLDVLRSVAAGATAPDVALSFPDGMMVAAAAAAFEADDRGLPLEWIKDPVPRWRHQFREVDAPANGPRYFVRVAPGNVQVFRRDQARAEATRARLSEARAKRAGMEWARELAVRDLPMVWDERVVGGADDGGDGLGPGRTGRVRDWSPKSRRRLVQTIGQLDLAPVVGRVRPPALVTLTLPGDWRAVCPDPAAGTAIIKRLEKRYLRKWHEPLQCIWKREFQGRGAPHWHLWMAPPADFDDFAPWLSQTWTECLGITDPHEYRKSLHAGTGVDFSRAADMRDPRRLALYFLKESLGGAEKAYQNSAPEDWGDGTTVGRFWGTKGLEKVTIDVPVRTEHGVVFWRALRRLRSLSLVSRRVLRCRRDHAHTGRCYRRVRRRAAAPASAGWVAVNDGPGVAFSISRLAEPPAVGQFGWDHPVARRDRAELWTLLARHDPAGSHVARLGCACG